MLALKLTNSGKEEVTFTVTPNYYSKRSARSYHVHGHSSATQVINWGAPRLPDSPSIRMDVWKGEVIASTEEELLSRIPG
jgi:hypothetical protein